MLAESQPLFFNAVIWVFWIWFSDHSSEIPHRNGSNVVSFDRAHVGAYQSHLCQIAHVPVKYNLFSKFKFVIFWRFFDLDPTWTLDPELSKYIFTNLAWVHTYWQIFSSLALRLPVQKLLWQSALVTTKSITSSFFCTVFWWNRVRIEVKIDIKSKLEIATRKSHLSCQF